MKKARDLLKSNIYMSTLTKLYALPLISATGVFYDVINARALGVKLDFQLTQTIVIIFGTIVYFFNVIDSIHILYDKYSP